MIVRKKRPDSNFYVLDKTIAEDSQLSWAGRGLLIYLLVKPDYWQVNINALINETGNVIGKSSGRDAVYGLLKELIDAGYVTREQERNDDGKLGERHYYVSEIKELSPLTDLPYTAEPLTAKPPLLSNIDKKEYKERVRQQGNNRASTSPRQKNKISIEAWTPESETLNFAITEAMNNGLKVDIIFVEKDVAKFRDYYLSKDEKRVDWDAQFRNWWRKTLEYMSKDSGKKPINNVTEAHCQKQQDTLANDRLQKPERAARAQQLKEFMKRL